MKCKRAISSRYHHGQRARFNDGNEEGFANRFGAPRFRARGGACELGGGCGGGGAPARKLLMCAIVAAMWPRRHVLWPHTHTHTSLPESLPLSWLGEILAPPERRANVSDANLAGATGAKWRAPLSHSASYGAFRRALARQTSLKCFVLQAAGWLSGFRACGLAGLQAGQAASSLVVAAHEH